MGGTQFISTLKGKSFLAHDSVISTMPLEEFDEVVVMRAAELILEGKLSDTVDRAIEKESGNMGSLSLRKLRSEKSALDFIEHFIND